MSHLTKTTADLDLAIGQAIRSIRIASGVSQEKLAGMLGVTFQQVQKYESGRNRVSVSALVLICKALSVSPMDIIGPHVGEKSDLQGLTHQIELLKGQLADIRAAVRATAR